MREKSRGQLEIFRRAPLTSYDTLLYNRYRAINISAVMALEIASFSPNESKLLFVTHWQL